MRENASKLFFFMQNLTKQLTYFNIVCIPEALKATFNSTFVNSQNANTNSKDYFVLQKWVKREF